MKTVEISLPVGEGGFTDDKDEAKKIRVNTLLPEIAAGNRIVLDFKNVNSSTQSFVHALLGEVLQRYKTDALSRIRFRNCNRLMKNLVELVVDYSLGGFRSDSASASDESGEDDDRAPSTASDPRPRRLKSGKSAKVSSSHKPRRNKA